MTREERRALLGDEVISHIHALVAAAPEPSPELVDELRRILTRPAGRVVKAPPSTAAAAA
ncbi:hypothetical protein ACIQNU_02570 [Streptomyces sp. NPDC091292]|uniref:hypothetical protein n=1 Tax=Streptomyces sp. NPDC091292 TaxID=3365991 RepID=UPI003811929D